MKYFGDAVTRVPFKRFGRHYFILKGDAVHPRLLYSPYRRRGELRLLLSHIGDVNLETQVNRVSYKS